MGCGNAVYLGGKIAMKMQFVLKSIPFAHSSMKRSLSILGEDNAVGLLPVIEFGEQE
jgi:hypothetical protein